MKAWMCDVAISDVRNCRATSSWHNWSSKLDRRQRHDRPWLVYNDAKGAYNWQWWRSCIRQLDVLLSFTRCCREPIQISYVFCRFRCNWLAFIQASTSSMQASSWWMVTLASPARQLHKRLPLCTVSRISITSFRRNVGIRSNDDDFDGDAIITGTCWTLPSVIGWMTSIAVCLCEVPSCHHLWSASHCHLPVPHVCCSRFVSGDFSVSAATVTESLPDDLCDPAVDCWVWTFSSALHICWSLDITECWHIRVPGCLTLSRCTNRHLLAFLLTYWWQLTLPDGDGVLHCGTCCQ